MKIHAANVAELVEICAGLAREGIIFTAYKIGGDWTIELTGY